jgi:ATP-dependent DNA helicase RecG
MLVAMENGYQAALMAPTEILATQHFLAMRKLLEKSSRKPRIVLLTGSLDEARKRQTRGLINRGEAQLVIGTHALIEEKVEFDRLGLVVVDEQHRFGVMQRFKLMKKPDQTEPDMLVMTATPIPRTLALSLYGDLDVSVLDELPPGRTPIVTRRVPGQWAEEVWEFVRKQAAQGRQTYIVYPVIEGTKEDEPELANPPARAKQRSSSPRPRRRPTPPRNRASNPPSRCMKNSATARWPAYASAFSTAASTRTRKRSSCAVFSAEKPTCWWPPPSSRSASMCPTPP